MTYTKQQALADRFSVLVCPKCDYWTIKPHGYEHMKPEEHLCRMCKTNGDKIEYDVIAPMERQPTMRKRSK